jgi:ADP-heptose:LPS heptosyltransferase
MFFTPDFKNRHKGITGLFRLYKDIEKQGKIDYVIDLHDVIRSKITRWLFRVNRVPVSVINKGKNEKLALIKGKRKTQLKHTVQRYTDVFARAGFHFAIPEGPWIIPSADAVNKMTESPDDFNGLNIGVAPYAKHELKTWPEENMTLLLNHIAEKQKSRFWLFGGKEEAERLNKFKDKVPESINMAGKITLEEELAIMSRLDFMIAMDSSNMHIAALLGIKVISLWGGTDPLTGFGAWMQPDHFSIRIPVVELTCRPCTVYGKGICHRGDFACMNWLTVENVLNEIRKSGLID